MQTDKGILSLKAGENEKIDAWVGAFNLFTEKDSQISYEILDTSLGLIDSTSGTLTALKERKNNSYCKRNQEMKII